MNTIVTVKEGALEGAFSDDKQSVIFKGVPYAAPPVGELRWKRPQPHAKWEGVRPALEFSAKAPQTDLSKMDLYGKEFYSDENLKQSEDCLYLNIWTPASAQPGDKLPVFFWIHGGAFTHGSGAEKEFDGEQFAKTAWCSSPSTTVSAHSASLCIRSSMPKSRGHQRQLRYLRSSCSDRLGIREYCSVRWRPGLHHGSGPVCRLHERADAYFVRFDARQD